MTAEKFIGGLREFNVAAGALTTDTWRDLLLEGLGRIVLKNPVGNPDLWRSKQMAEFFGWTDPFAFSYDGYVGGRSRANWQATVGEPARGVLPGIDQTGAETITRGEAVFAAVPAGTYEIGWLSNNLPYIEALEDGWSKQAPQGMLGPTFVELEAIAQSVVDASIARFNAEPPQ